jgi:hypothetical protein
LDAVRKASKVFAGDLARWLCVEVERGGVVAMMQRPQREATRLSFPCLFVSFAVA